MYLYLFQRVDLADHGLKAVMIGVLGVRGGEKNKNTGRYRAVAMVDNLDSMGS